MKPRRDLLVVAGAAIVIFAGAVVASTVPGGTGGDPAQTVADGVSAPAPAPASSAPGVTGAPRATSAPGHRSAAPHRPTKATQQDDSLLSAEQPGGATAAPYRLPKPTRQPRAIGPDDLAVQPGSNVTSKSTSTDGNATQVFISATSSAAPRDTVAYYQSVFTALGMTGAPLPAIGGARAISFTRGPDAVTVTVSPHGTGGSSCLIHGVLRSGA